MLHKTPTGTWLPAWVPQSTTTLSILLLLCSIIQSSVSTPPPYTASDPTNPTDCYLQTGGYDGSMLNGLNILPSYTDYFNLNPATTGLNTASVFIGSIFGPMIAGVVADRLGRRPGIFWGAIVTLVGIVLQTAAQDIAMFVIARVVLGFGSAVGGIAAGVYLSETFSSRWRAWGVGMLNNFY